MKQILVVAPSWIGDAVLSQPLLTGLKARWPLAEIDIVAPPWVVPIYCRMNEVRDVVAHPFGHGDLKLLKRRAFGRALAVRTRYDRAYILPNTIKSALIAWFADIPELVAYRGEARAWLLSDCRTLDKARLPTMAERFAWLADDADRPLHQPVATPALKIDEVNRSRCLQKLGLLGRNHAKPIIALCPGAEYGPAKRWPVGHFATYAKQALDRGEQVWLFGSKADHTIGDEINQMTDWRCENLCGQTALADAIDLLSLASHVVTNDSGLMHVACAVGVPVTALYGSSSPNFTPPLSPRARVISLKLECSPCFERVCPLGHFRCMNDLSPEILINTPQP